CSANPSRRQLFALLGGLATGYATGCTAAGPVPGASPIPAWGPVTLEVVDRDAGQPLPVYTRHGRSWVPGRPGARYALRLRNQGDGRVLVVLSVDGVNVITGQTADWAQTGYVIEPGRSHDITGWRKSDTRVAAFEFAPLAQSYAARTGRPDHVGVIGMAVFRERPAPLPAPQVAMPAPPPTAAAKEAAPAAPAAPGAAARDAAPGAVASAGAEANEQRPASRLGTGHGASEWSVSRRTAFERASSTPDQLARIEYDSLDRLVAAGIVPAPRPLPSDRPSPFPGSPLAFVPDPPRW
ncbi:MAG: hypothetical protein RJA10_4490, partial [Pseudomonadota bacterium]